MFWGLVLEPSKKYTQKVDQTFHISQAALDLKSCDQEPIQLVVEYENSNFILATLCKKANIFQVPLDLIFKTGDQVSFRTIGKGKVHLSGYHVLEDIDSLPLNGEEESDLEELEEIEDIKGKRKKNTPKGKGNKKAKLDETNEDESEDDDMDEEDEDESDGDFDKKAKKKDGKGSSILMEEFDEDDEDEGDDDDDDDDDDDEFGEEEEEDDDDLDEEDMEEMEFDDSDSEEQPKTPKSEGKKAPVTPNGVASDSKGKQKQKKDKSLLGTQGKDGKTPNSEAKSKGEKHLKNSFVDSTPQRKNQENAKNEQKKPKSPKAEGSPQKKVLEGGVIAEEIKVGSGPVAKPGKMVNVYYTGVLASTKKQFDSVQNGPGFKFRIGRQEVIKGWDIGLSGMKVGGTRKLTIPPHLAYGSKGSPPVIPPNSTLVFTVELRGLS